MMKHTKWLLCLVAVLGLSNRNQAQPPPEPTPGSDSSVSFPLGPMSSRPASLPTAVTTDPAPVCDASASGLFAEAGVYVLHPYFSGNPAYFTTFANTSTTPGPTATTSINAEAGRKEFDYGMSVSPWVSLGYEWDDGAKVRVRWWHFDEDANVSTVNTDASGGTSITSATAQGFTLHSPGPGLIAGVGPDVLSFHSDLQLEVIDAEVARELRFHDWVVEVAGGARYVHLSEHYLGTLSNSGTTQALTITDSAELFSRHHFDGAGPTLALGVRWPCGNTGFSLYGNARGSLVFGSNEQDAALGSDVTRVGATTTTTREVSRSAGVSRSDLLPILEMELGAEYRMDLGRVHPYLRAGLVGQTWFNAGNASGLGNDLGLLGVAATAGLDF
ncbi:MAG TPA: Lpg1974 family pore-forming outer membrane protein [Gemmataceae bacterium]|nr:Lpg1974 family pore-forming outer membrane protein [Gemmataceae bacterium]